MGHKYRISTDTFSDEIAAGSLSEAIELFLKKHDETREDEIEVIIKMED